MPALKPVTDVRELELRANALRRSVIEMLLAAGSGHSAGPLGLADVFSVLYFNALKHDPANPNWSERDFLVLSNGHVCPIRYAAMAHGGYFPVAELQTLRKLGSRLQGHPERLRLPGLETTSGPLGSGLAQAAGMALALRLDGKPNKVFCVTSDGEHDEGNTWEAVLFAAKYELSNLIIIVDRNRIQIDGNTEKVLPLEPFLQKYAAFGWRVLEADGHNYTELLDAIAKAKTERDKPVVLIAHTTPGKGVSFMVDRFEWHGKAPNAEEAKAALAELDAERQRIENQ